jgi:hypothetical protein
MGRPRGSKNKSKITKAFSNRRGRPAGSKNKKRSMSDYGKTSLVTLKCSSCATPTKAGSETVSVLCPNCTQKSLPTPDWGYHKKMNVDPNAPKRKRGRPRKNPVVVDVNAPKRKRGRPRTRLTPIERPNSGFGRGWHLKKKFVAPDGRKFSFGKPV